MNIEEWAIVISVFTAAAAILAPWMLAVQARLAVVYAQMERIEKKVDRLLEAHEQRLPECIRHASAFEELFARLEHQQTQLDEVRARLQEVA